MSPFLLGYTYILPSEKEDNNASWLCKSWPEVSTNFFIHFATLSFSHLYTGQNHKKWLLIQAQEKGRIIMKKLIAITLCAVMVLSFAAC
jgi:hypothetical protein